MTKTELITFLRDPSKLSSKDLEELENVVHEHPYFLSGRLLLAKGSKELKDPKAKQRIASAAIYSTDRILLKKYLSGNLFFLREPVPVEDESESKESTSEKVVLKETPKEVPSESRSEDPPRSRRAKPASSPPAGKREDKRPSALKPVKTKPSPQVPDVPSGELDALLDELQKDMKDLKESRQHFVEVQEKIEEEDAVSAALEKAAPEVNEEKSSGKEAIEALTEPDETKEDLSSSGESDQPGSEDEDEIIAKKLAEISGSLLKTKEEEPEESEEDSQNLRAERTINEPRFSRFSTRSYLKDPESEKEEKDSSRDNTEEQKPASGKEKETTPSKTEEPSSEETKEKATKETTRKSVSKPSKTKESTKTPAKKATDKKAGTSRKTTTKASTSKKASTSGKTTTKAKSTTTKKSTAAKKTTATRKSSTTKKAPAKKTTTTKSTAAKTKATKKTDEAKDDGKGEREKKQQIIDKFIKESPSIKYKRGEEQSAQDLGEPSGSWDPNLASEYLAEIYLHQGNKVRAIEIYKALSLKYPEKKSYFADLISKIE